MEGIRPSNIVINKKKRGCLVTPKGRPGPSRALFGPIGVRGEFNRGYASEFRDREIKTEENGLGPELLLARSSPAFRERIEGGRDRSFENSHTWSGA